MADVTAPWVSFTDPAGDTLVVDARVGESVMQVARRHRIPGVLADCGGFMQCATCHVYVDEADRAGLPPMSEDEDMMLEGTASERLAGSRLSCQLPIGEHTTLRVTLPARQR
ncbi:2Fe-2S iron-sulfur cluster-binding protein [Nocardioides sp. AE5]|uniref:2Fe-2S iron-sulfur cluster-binding protein n=1 Tax=Nocardioides sp. AE5 TaxID=2962573 RepID=UPI00288222BE|nr:2Fe-2S iron-sulfur cluster-binding protein [Nocardioides sp. AE5]MDT0203451.1 2Fe-2S iron-sulfur cluster-binding protein [Nocardioides sp. AE5]